MTLSERAQSSMSRHFSSRLFNVLITGPERPVRKAVGILEIFKTVGGKTVSS